MKIIALNCNCLINLDRRQELKVFFHKHKPDVVCLKGLFNMVKITMYSKN